VYQTDALRGEWHFQAVQEGTRFQSHGPVKDGPTTEEPLQNGPILGIQF
jgi:hypothetical protein